MKALAYRFGGETYYETKIDICGTQVTKHCLCNSRDFIELTGHYDRPRQEEKWEGIVLNAVGTTGSAYPSEWIGRRVRIELIEQPQLLCSNCERSPDSCGHKIKGDGNCFGYNQPLRCG